MDLSYTLHGKGVLGEHFYSKPCTLRPFFCLNTIYTEENLFLPPNTITSPHVQPYTLFSPISLNWARMFTKKSTILQLKVN